MTTQEILDAVVEDITRRGLSLNEVIISDEEATANTDEGISVKYLLTDLTLVEN
jgi:hypothetical protein